MNPLENIRIYAYIEKADINILRDALKRQIKQLEKIEESPSRLARIGQAYARSIAPAQTRTLLKAIRYKTTKKYGAELRINIATLNTNPSNWSNFNYAAYMHYNDGVMGRGVKITSGDPQFMYSTFDYIKKEFKEDIKLSFGRH